jgi:phosphate/sulfate permease
MNTFKDNQAAMNMWNAVKGDTLPLWAIVLILGALVAVIVAVFLFRYFKEKKKLARRRAVKERQMKEMQKERQERQLERLRILKEAGALQDEPESPQGEALSIAETPQTDDVAPKAEGENAAN